MKTIICNTLCIFFCIHALNAQTFQRIKDEAIVAQHKRMVFERWGDFRPYPKYFFGIQTNFSYAVIWGNWAPSRNRRYKRGRDIRPLDADGLETRRHVEIGIQKRQAEKISQSVDSILQHNKKDLAHWTPLTVDADPLWLLYYKRMLKPLKDFPSNPQSASDWGLYDNEVYQRLQNNGDLATLKEKLDVLKDTYHISRTVAMPRGKRFMMYHETLIGWRRFFQQTQQFNKNSFRALDLDHTLHDIRNHNGEYHHRDDKEIVREILTQHQYLSE